MQGMPHQKLAYITTSKSEYMKDMHCFHEFLYFNVMHSMWTYNDSLGVLETSH